MRKSVIILLTLVGVGTMSLANSNDEDGWTETIRENGITAFIGPKNSEGIRPTRTIMRIEAPAEKVLAAILDIDRYTEWVPHCDESQKIASGSESSVYFYQVFSAPLIKDRDLVAKVEVTKLFGEYRVVLTAAPNHLSIDRRKVRIQHFKSEYIIKPMADGTTQVVLHSEVDMEGIPSFLINWTNERQPYQTFSQFRQHILNA